MIKQTAKGELNTTFYLLPIPFVLFVSVSDIGGDAVVYALHITPWFEIGFNWRKGRWK